MIPTAQQTGFTPEAFEAFLAARREPDWLVETAPGCVEHVPGKTAALDQ